MNSQIQGYGNDQLVWENGRRTMSIPLDALPAVLPEGQIVLQFAQNFDATANPFTSLDVYMDNIRLVSPRHWASRSGSSSS